MKKSIRLLVLLLAFACVLPAMVSCDLSITEIKDKLLGDKTDANTTETTPGTTATLPSTTTTAPSTTETTPGTTDTTPDTTPSTTQGRDPGTTPGTNPGTDPGGDSDKYLDDLEPYNFDFDSAIFKVLSVESKEGTYTRFDMWELTGDIVDDAVYTRNRIIESRFNIILDSHTKINYNECQYALKNEALCPIEYWDLIMLINRDAYTAIAEDMIYTPKDLKYIDMSKPYYLKDVNDALTIDGVPLFAYSDESMYTFERSACIVFNQNMIKDKDMDNPYDLVENNQWTYEKMFQMISDGTVTDTSGNTSTWGCVGVADYTGVSFWLGCGQKIIKMNAAKTNMKFDLIDNENIQTITTKMRTLMDNKQMLLEWNRGTDDSPWIRPFASGNALFQTNIIGKVWLLRNVESFDYGVVPYPKYNTDQDDYYSRVVDAWLHVVPKTCTDVDRASVILEALASGSSQLVFPAYYEKLLKYSVLRDEKSIDMLEIIRAHRVFDLADVTWHQQIRYNLDTKLFSENPSYKDVATFGEDYNSAAKKKINELLTIVANLKAV